MTSVDGGHSYWSCQNEWATPGYKDIDMWDNWMIETVHHHLKSLSPTRRQKLIEESRDIPISPGIMLIKGYNESIGAMQDAILAGLVTDMIYEILYPERDAVAEAQSSDGHRARAVRY